MKKIAIAILLTSAIMAVPKDSYASDNFQNEVSNKVQIEENIDQEKSENTEDLEVNKDLDHKEDKEKEDTIKDSTEEIPYEENSNNKEKEDVDKSLEENTNNSTKDQSDSDNKINEKDTKEITDSTTQEESTEEIKETSSLKINEVQTKDPNGGNDYVEIYNDSDEDIDISGYYILDDNHKREVEALKEGTMISSKGYFVFEEGVNFSFGLGKKDEVNLFNRDGKLLDSFSWKKHPDGVYARDEKGEFIETNSTKGYENIEKNIVINEVESSDESGGKDYVEIFNRSNEKKDISNWYILDSKKSHKITRIKENTFINPNGYFVFEEGIDFDFGLGSNDEVNLFDKDGNLVDRFLWTTHAPGTYGRIEDGFGEFTQTNPTKGRKNTPYEKEAINIDTKDWPGLDDIEIVDKEKVFDLQDLSGLDQDGKWIYGINNKEGRFVVFKLEDGKVVFAKGFGPKGKSIAFIKDKDNPKADGPDSEGITVDKNGSIYIAVERDNSDKNVNKNMILEVKDPFQEADRIVADKQWDITDILPDVGANQGIETIEWVGFDNLSNRLYDQKLNKPFDPNDYKDAYGEGVYFVGVEADGCIYALILKDEGAEIISKISTNLGGVMGMDYDIENNILWALSDDGYDNIHTAIQFNGTNSPKILNIKAANGMNKKLNNEGFVILNSSKDQYRKVLYFMDGSDTNALRLGYIKKDYVKDLGFEVINPDNPTGEDINSNNNNSNDNSSNKDDTSNIKDKGHKDNTKDSNIIAINKKYNRKAQASNQTLSPKTGVSSIRKAIITLFASLGGLVALKKRK